MATPLPRPPISPRAIVEREPLPLSTAFHHAPQESRSLVAAQRGSTPERLERALGGELETILHKTLKKSPDERYGSVAELARRSAALSRPQADHRAS